MLELKSRSLKLMGCYIDIFVFYDINSEIILDETVEMLKYYEHKFSANDDSSELMKINHNAGLSPVKVHEDLYNLVKIGKYHSCAENSLLNIAMGPLIQTWRIGFNDAKVPTAQEINKLLNITNPRKIILNDDKREVFLREKNMLINLGALAKGYIADLIVDFLKNKGIKSGLINLGGNILTFGDALHNNDKHWHIGIQNPSLPRGNHLFVLRVKDESVVTSGIYERKYTESGKTYHHILSPKTGYPVENNIASLTIISKLSVDGEIWTTRLFGMGVQDIMREVERIPDIEAIVVTLENKVYYTSGILDKIIL